MKTHKTLLAALTLAAAVSAQGSTDYSPAIWNPPCNSNYYTSGYGHKFHVVHDMEGFYSSSISMLNGCGWTASSVHYLVNSGSGVSGWVDRDGNGSLETFVTDTDGRPAGEITQMIREANYAWHARCWNLHSTGCEHEGFRSNPAWYSDAQYQASATLTRHLSATFGWTKDRNHVVGHDEKKTSAWVSWASSGLGIDPTCNTHSDPGPYWDWAKYMNLVKGASAAKAAPSMFYITGAGTENTYRWSSSGSAFSTLATSSLSGYDLNQVGQNLAAADVNGDGKTDNVLAYQYPDGTMRLHVFLNGNSYQGPAGWFQSGTFAMGNVAGRMVGGDFNGDGRGDVAMLYDAGGGTLKIFRFLSTGSSFTYDTATLTGYFLDNVQDNVAASDVNGDGNTDIVAAYQYPDGTMRLHVFINGNSYAGSAGWYQSGTFPLANVNGRMVGGDFTRKTAAGEESISLSQLQIGQRLLVRNGELIPADAKLISGAARIDYSFVTGESEPVAKNINEHLYAGGRQIGGAIEIETIKAVSQGYLTSLWNQDAFKKEKAGAINTLINVYSVRFTKIILAIAAVVALFWWFTDAGMAVRAFTSVLIVACPCAVVLGPPFALGTAQRLLARRNVFLKNPAVVETLAKIDAVVFDKTGTLTAAGGGSISFEGPPLTGAERDCLAALTKNSTHPFSVRIAEVLGESAAPVRSFRETAGCGIEGLVDGNEVLIGSWAWLESNGISGPAQPEASVGSSVHVAVNERYRGCFVLTSAVRPRTEAMIHSLGAHCELALLSGDNERERTQFSKIFGTNACLQFNQSPQKKFKFVEELHRRGKTVMMVGDGLNDAGALKNADVGVAVVENISAFSPASDVIMSAGMIARLHDVLRFSQAAVRVVRLSFVISSVYNVVGISIAASGKLAPVVCAVLMPLSSITIIAFACGMTTWLGKRTFEIEKVEGSSPQSRNESPLTPLVPRGERGNTAPECAFTPTPRHIREAA